jgi:hypothetical protein
MPTVPKVPTQTQQPTPQPLRRDSAPDLAFGAGGQGLVALGQGLGSAAQDVARVALDMKEQNDDAAAKEADNRLSAALRTRMFDPQNGYYAKKGKDAFDGFGRVEEDIDAEISKLSDGLANDRQRRLFSDVSGRRKQSELDGAWRYAQKEHGVWLDGVNDARIQSAIDDGAARYNSDPDRIRAYNTGLSEILEKGQRNGWSPEAMQAKGREYASSFYVAAIERAAVDDPVMARGLMTRYMDKLSPQAAGQMDRLTRESAHKAAVTSETGRILASPVAIVQDASAMLAPVVAQLESGGNQDAVSSKGAIGVMQVMPDTARSTAAKIGLPYDEDRLRTDADYNRRIGTAYLDEMLTRYCGNATLALAAYNAGPGAVDGWVSKIGDPRTGEISDQDFAKAIPFPETRNYVAKGQKAIGSADLNGSVMGMPPLSAQLVEVDKIRDASVRADVRREVMANYEAKVKAKSAARDQLERDAFAAIDQGYSIWDLKPQVRIDLGPERVARMRSYQEAKAKGSVATDWGVYDDLRRMKSEAPKDFSGLNLMTYRDKLADGEFKEVSGWQTSAAKGVLETGAGTLDQQTNDMLNGLGIKDKAARGRVSRQVSIAVDALGEETGKKPTFADRQKIVDRFALDVAKRGIFRGKGTLSSIKGVSNVPKDFVSAWRSRVPSASDQDVVDAYVQMNALGRL